MIPCFIMLMISMVISGCSEHEEDIDIPAKSGDAIQFGVAQVATSRTAYVDRLQIDWEKGDKIGIYCEQATSCDDNPGGLWGIGAKTYKDATYSISETAPDNHRYHATIAADGRKLLWGSDEGVHTFYGAYPADHIKTYPNDKSKQFEMQYITNQLCEVDAVNVDNKVINTKPDMKNAYMMAKNVVNPSGKHVLLDFHPVMTTLDISIVADEIELPVGVISQGITITGVSVIMPKYLTNGVFKYDLTDANTDHTLTGGKLGSEIGDGPESIFVGIKNGNDNYVTIKEGQTLNLMAFLPPIEGSKMSGTKIKIHTSGAYDLTATMKNDAVWIAEGRITINLPKIREDRVTPNNWMSQLDGNVNLKRLSIPGYVCAASTTTDDIERLLNCGVRAFDIKDAADKKGLVSSLNSFLATNKAESIILWDVDNLEKVMNEVVGKDSWLDGELGTISASRGKMIGLEKSTINGSPYFTATGRLSTSISYQLFKYFNNTTSKNYNINSAEWDKSNCGVWYLKDKTVNKDIYDVLSTSQLSKGCAGIVMIPNAGTLFDDTGTKVYGDLLVQAVIDCNFKFNLHCPTK